MVFSLNRFEKFNFRFILTILCICAVGGLTIFSSTFYPAKEISEAFKNQLLFYAAGGIIFILISLFDYRYLKNRFIIAALYLLTIAGLVLVLSIGVSVGAAQRWISLGSFTLQPSEFAKLTLVLIVAFGLTFENREAYQEIFNIYKTYRHSLGSNIREFLRSEIFVKLVITHLFFFTIVALIFAQKSLGNTVLIVFLYLFMLSTVVKLKVSDGLYLLSALLALNLSFEVITLAGVKEYFNLNFDVITLALSIIGLLILTKVLKRNLILVAVIFAGFFFLKPGWTYVYDNVLLEYQRERIETFINPADENSLDEDWNRQKSLDAIGSGGFSGKGFLNGDIVNNKLLPYAFTDFAFAAYAEQFGFVGGVALIILYLLLILNIIGISNKTHAVFGRLICTGIAVIILLNVTQHIGMNLGRLPITGVPLPLISYGGSAILTIFVGLGLVHSVYISNQDDINEVTQLVSY